MDSLAIEHVLLALGGSHCFDEFATIACARQQPNCLYPIDLDAGRAFDLELSGCKVVQ